MLGRRFYDWISVLLILFMLSFFVFSIGNFTSEKRTEKIQDCYNQGLSGEELTNCIYANSNIATTNLYKSMIKVILLIYWIFILVLAIQLAIRKKIKIIDVVLVAILSPIAIIYYFATLRGKLKNVESNLND